MREHRSGTKGGKSGKIAQVDGPEQGFEGAAASEAEHRGSHP